ncbi:MAG: DegV family EDD domain-containing protein [Bacteroidetes bacterium]|nr:DegV family EDD domain-containing protein [Bacteroidota bacterium]
MNEQLSTVRSLNGKNLYYSVIAGAHKIFEHQDYLNKINVFPVADADTGTNLASTMQFIVNSPIPTGDVKVAAMAIADAAIVGARGNSGIIFAQFLYGFGNEIKGNKDIDVIRFAEIILRAVRYAYDAIANPVEGTMITVIREWAEFIYSIKNNTDNFLHLLTEALKIAKESLKETQKTLAVLAKNKVVDAGAKGFVYFLEGMIEFFKTGKLRQLIKSWKLVKAVVIPEATHGKINHRYCTEALITGEGFDNTSLKKSILHFGDSLVIAGSPQKVHVHIHTDEPAELFQILTKYGHITYQKVDDMFLQNEAAHRRKWDIGLATDSTCDLPQELMDRYQIHMVPVTLIADGTQYLDKLTITAEQFYQLIEHVKQFPTTSQPGIQEFINKYSFLASHYPSIIAVNLSKALSGTWSNSLKAAENVAGISGKKISVINSKSISGGLGLLIYRMALAIENGWTHEKIVKKTEEWIDKISVLVSPQNLKSFVRGGRVSPMKGFIANLLNLKPIITIDKEGKAIMFEKAFSQKGNIRKVLKVVKKLSDNRKIWEYAVVYSNRETKKTAEWYAIQLEKILGKKAAFIYSISPVIGIHAGRGTIALTMMFE